LHGIEDVLQGCALELDLAALLLAVDGAEADACTTTIDNGLRHFEALGLERAALAVLGGLVGDGELNVRDVVLLALHGVCPFGTLVDRGEGHPHSQYIL